MKSIVLENIIKNITIAIVLLFTYSPIQTSIQNSNLDKSDIGNLLIAVSILAVTACFGNFAFTYGEVKLKSISNRMIAHTVTGVLMLLIGLSLEITSVLVSLLINSFYIFNFSLLLLYFASVLYDFWDLQR